MSTTTQDAGTEGLVDQAKSQLGDVASDVQDKAVELKDQGRGKLGETLDRRTTEVGGQARQAAATVAILPGSRGLAVPFGRDKR